MFAKPEKIILTLFFILYRLTFSLAEFETGSTYHGFILLKKQFVKEVNAECLYFKHIQSGARLFKIAADDVNKTFSIAFKTLPENDYGTPHIMEHSVFGGSKHFPVKNTLVTLNKGSLNTLLNAMTGNEVTIYPIASMNKKDYFNLMQVYLDAVFYPLIYQNPRTFKQEGWHYELTDKEGELTYNGIVYNEMKGAYSDPTEELYHWIYKYLFPDNNYQYDSAGFPSEIPKLSYDYFLDFHRRFYHPSNSYIFLYGDADLDEELSLIDRKYLSDFQRSDFQPEIPFQKPFSQMKEVTIPYSLPEGTDTTHQTYLVLCFVAGLNTDLLLTRALEILTDALVNHESAPLRLALQDAGIGQDISAELYDSQQNIFRIEVANANSSEKNKFLEVVMKTLRETAAKGMDKKLVEGVMNRLEFQLREGEDAQKGLSYNLQILNSWLFADDPILNLQYEKSLAELKKALEKNYLETVIRQYLINNPHSLLLAMEPKAGLESERNARITAELQKFRDSLDEKALNELVKETNELIDYQKQPDTPEALATIPLLELKDIEQKAKWYDYQVKKTADIPVIFHEDFTNGIVYLQFFFDLRVLPQNLLPFAALLAETMGSLNTDNYSYGDLTNELNIHTGGCSNSIELFLEDSDDEQLRPKLLISIKGLSQQVSKMVNLVEEMVLRTHFSDTERLKALLIRHHSQLENQLQQNAYRFTQTRLLSYFTNYGMFKEVTSGLEYYWFVTDLVQSLDQQLDEISADLSQTADLLFKKENYVMAVTCEKDDFKPSIQQCARFGKSLPPGKSTFENWKFNFENKQEGILTASQVQYVLKGYDYKKLDYQWNGKMQVLSQILLSDWLLNRIRIIGGAYWGWTVILPSGQVFFSSYRDPNLRETLETFDATPEYLLNFSANETEMTRFIIGTVSRYLDRPLTPPERGERAVQMYFEKTTQADLQAIRDAVLSTSAQDIRNFSKMISDILKQNDYCVYGSEAKIQTEKELFKSLIKLTE
jgi:Zn-dependent M16 (insulinase) family peptidase